MTDRTIQASDFGKVAVLMGGWANEREVSLHSGQAVLDSLRQSGVDAHPVDMNHDLMNQLQGFDRVFNVVHGRGGEDGLLQGVLDLLQLPATGSNLLGSAIAMDKYRTKLVWLGLGLPTPRFVLIETEDQLTDAAELGFPLMVKAALEGSSIGVARVENTSQLRDAWIEARSCDSHVIAEQWIAGDEYTASILGEQALPLIRLQTSHQFYDYAAKYQSDDTRYLLPCGLDTTTEQTLQTLSLRAFKAVGASGWGRVDLMRDADGQPWLIEVNTVPGMTSHSLVPMAAAAIGVDFNDLTWRILAQTLEPSSQ
jgi:D-alanine-D-alanine ligase